MINGDKYQYEYSRRVPIPRPFFLPVCQTTAVIVPTTAEENLVKGQILNKASFGIDTDAYLTICLFLCNHANAVIHNYRSYPVRVNCAKNSRRLRQQLNSRYYCFSYLGVRCTVKSCSTSCVRYSTTKHERTKTKTKKQQH